MRKLWANLWWGAGWGLFVGIIYSVFAAGILLLKGGFSSAPRGVTPLALLVFYLLSGVAGGLIVGLFRPWLRRRSCSTAVGILATFPASVGVLRMIAGPIVHWRGAEWFGAVGTSFLLGGYFGYSYWDLQHYDPMAQIEPSEPASREAKRRSQRKSPRRDRER